MDMCILLNGKIIMVDDQFSIQQAVAIEGDRIKAVGQNATVRALAGPTTEVIDLHGRTVIPGLIDNHNHFIRGTDYWADAVRLDGVSTRTAVLDLLRQRASVLKTGHWLLTLGGWSEDQLEGIAGTSRCANLTRLPATILRSFSPSSTTRSSTLPGSRRWACRWS